MTRYKQADFADEDTSSIGSIHLNEPSVNPAMHIRYHTARVSLNFYHFSRLILISHQHHRDHRYGVPEANWKNVYYSLS